MRRSAAQLGAPQESVAHHPSRRMSPHSHPVDPGRTCGLVRGYTPPGVSGACAGRSANPTCPAKYRRDSPYSTDRVCVERRVSRLHLSGDPCPQIVPPSYKSIVFLLPFALCTAFPRSDYYGSSALGFVHLRPSRLAQSASGQAIRVPVFRSPTFVSLGGGLYPWRYGRWAQRELVPSRTRCPRPAARRHTAAPLRIALPPRHHATWRRARINSEASVAHFVISP